MKLLSQAFRSRRSQGIALVIVMISIFVLSILAGGFAYSMKVETRLARNASNEAELEWMGRSGVEYARWVLAMSRIDPLVRWDDNSQTWATGHGFLGPTNAPITEVENPLHFRKGTVSWHIVDLESKININTCLNHETLLEQALMSIGVDAGEMTPIANSILDWLDRDDLVRVQGAESEFYQNRDPDHPYYAKNGPIDNLSELLLIKGVTPELYWGSSSTNHPPGVFLSGFSESRGPRQAVGYPFGLADVFTPISSGLINMNTAPEPVLQIALGGDAAAAQRLIEVRSGANQDGMALPIGSPGFGVLDALVSAGLSRQAAMLAAPYFTVNSFTFQVTVDAEINGYHRTYNAILGRSPGQKDVQILNFYWKD